ncbi:MAG TPA: chemotaxis protein CheW [Chthonomonadaceae bacterium]|nr:chemotaxis protein CheW [Chthonomonadaceae bacterium]
MQTKNSTAATFHREDSRGEQVVTVCLGQETYGIAIEDVESIVRWEPLTRLPRLPRFLAGLLPLRGQVIPVIDLRARLDLPAGESAGDRRIVIVRVQEATVGLIVDAVREVIRVEAGQIETKLPLISGLDAESAAYLRGVANLPQGFVILLALTELLSTDERTQLARLEARASAQAA